MHYPVCDPAQIQASSSETDMQTISDSEISSRGLAALEKMLDNGPVHVIKDDRLAYVVLSEAEYSRLKTRPTSSAGNRPGVCDGRGQKPRQSFICNRYRCSGRVADWFGSLGYSSFLKDS